MAKKKNIKRKSKAIRKTTKKKVVKKTKKKIVKKSATKTKTKRPPDKNEGETTQACNDKYDIYKKSGWSDNSDIYKKWPSWGDRFLEKLTQKGGYYAAARAINIGAKTFYRYRRGCKEFREAVEDIYHAETDELEQCLMERAKHGTDDLVIHEGEPVRVENPYTGEYEYLYKRKYETALSIFMLKGRRREVYYPEGGVASGTADDKAAAVRESIMEIMKVMGGGTKVAVE